MNQLSKIVKMKQITNQLNHQSQIKIRNENKKKKLDLKMWKEAIYTLNLSY